MNLLTEFSYVLDLCQTILNSLPGLALILLLSRSFFFLALFFALFQLIILDDKHQSNNFTLFIKNIPVFRLDHLLQYLRQLFPISHGLIFENIRPLYSK